MNLIQRTIKASPFVGVLGLVSDSFGFFPLASEKKELKDLEKVLDVNVFTGSLAQSSLLGVLSVAIDSKIAVSELVEKAEIAFLKKQGLDVFVVQNVTALGNLLVLNNNGGIASPLLSDEQINDLENFFKVNFTKTRIAESDVCGASIVVTKKGFIVSSNATEEDVNLLEKTFKVNGAITTANYGDKFVGNSVLANSQAGIVGLLTSGVEMMRIDEGLRGV